VISLLKIISELKINKPKKFRPGEKVILHDRIVTLSNNPNTYYTEEFEEPSYLVDNEKTGERWYQSESDLKKINSIKELKINKPNPKGNIPLEYYTPELEKLIKQALPLMIKNRYYYISYVNGLGWTSAYRKGRYEEFNGKMEFVLSDQIIEYSVFGELPQIMFDIGWVLEELSCNDEKIEGFLLDKFGNIWIGDKYNQIVYKKKPINELKINNPIKNKRDYIQKYFEENHDFIKHLGYSEILENTIDNSNHKLYEYLLKDINNPENPYIFEYDGIGYFIYLDYEMSNIIIEIV